MARVTLIPTALIPNAGVADPTGTLSVAGAGNGFTVAYTGGKSLFFRVANASGGTGTFSVLAGAQPLAPSSGQGPATISLTTGTTQWAGPYESARVIQSDGSLSIETSVALTVTAFTIDGKYVG